MRLLTVCPISRSILFFLILFVVTGCSDVPRSYRIDTGVFPEYQDNDVRFRTTYYLRVFDVCPVEAGMQDIQGSSAYEKRMGALTSRKSGQLHLVKDSLFRFRMTGQASALYSNLHFESGVLSADEVDPFGKTINYEEEKRKFEVFNAALKKAGAAAGSDRQNIAVCPSGDPLDRRFYLLGPEGIRELNRNERLVMAMYTDSKPLISSLKALAGQRGNQEAEHLWPFDLEMSKTRAESSLSALDKKDAYVKEPGGLPSPRELSDTILPLFGKERVR